MGEDTRGLITVVSRGTPWWVAWAALLLGGVIGFVLGLAAVILGAG